MDNLTGSPLARSGQFIVRQMDFDEKRANILDRLGSSSNGVYHFPENHNVRLSLTKTVPIPQAILDEYDRMPCARTLFPVHLAYRRASLLPRRPRVQIVRRLAAGARFAVCCCSALSHSLLAGDQSRVHHS